MAAKINLLPANPVDYVFGFGLGMTGNLFIVTALLELTGLDALLWSLLLAASVALTAVAYRYRRAVLRRAAQRAAGMG